MYGQKLCIALMSPYGDARLSCEEEIRLMVDAGEERGTIDEDEKEMINNIFEFDKLILMQHFGMTEKEAHKYIEQRAMESRSSRRAIAENIIKSYE